MTVHGAFGITLTVNGDRATATMPQAESPSEVFPRYDHLLTLGWTWTPDDITVGDDDLVHVALTRATLSASEGI